MVQRGRGAFDCMKVCRAVSVRRSLRVVATPAWSTVTRLEMGYTVYVHCIHTAVLLEMGSEHTCTATNGVQSAVALQVRECTALAVKAVELKLPDAAAPEETAKEQVEKVTTACAAALQALTGALGLAKKNRDKLGNSKQISDVRADGFLVALLR